MILLFGEKAQNSSTAHNNTGIKNPNNPVENSGILAMNPQAALSFLSASEYDDFIASNPVAINYAAYSEWSDSDNTDGFMSGFADAVATLDSEATTGFDASGFAGACSSSSDCGGFCSVC